MPRAPTLVVLLALRFATACGGSPQAERATTNPTHESPSPRTAALSPPPEPPAAEAEVAPPSAVDEAPATDDELAIAACPPADPAPPASAPETPAGPVITITFQMGHFDERSYTQTVDVLVGTVPPRSVRLPRWSLGCDLAGFDWVQRGPGGVVLGCYFGGGGDYVVIEPDGGDRWRIRTFSRAEAQVGDESPVLQEERVRARFRAPAGATLHAEIVENHE